MKKPLDAVFAYVDLVAFREIGIDCDVINSNLVALNAMAGEFHEMFKDRHPEEDDMAELAYDVKDCMLSVIREELDADDSNIKHLLKVVDLCAFAVSYVGEDSDGDVCLYVHLGLFDQPNRARIMQGVVAAPECYGFTQTH